MLPLPKFLGTSYSYIPHISPRNEREMRENQEAFNRFYGKKRYNSPNQFPHQGNKEKARRLRQMNKK